MSGQGTSALSIIICAWCLTAVVIANSYTTSTKIKLQLVLLFIIWILPLHYIGIKSLLTTPRYRPVISSLEDLVRKPDYQIILQNNTRKWIEIMVCYVVLYPGSFMLTQLAMGQCFNALGNALGNGRARLGPMRQNNIGPAWGYSGYSIHQVNTFDKLIVEKKQIFFKTKTATSGTFKNIGDTLRNHPENSLNKLDDANDLIINHKKILAEVRKICVILMYSTTHTNDCISFLK